jgi:phosphohistidine phosphatase
MDFYLVRHGEAVSENVDPQRPLSPAGRNSVERVARNAAGRNIQPSVIFHSGILRAKQTAEIVAAALASMPRVEPLRGLLPQDDPFIAKGDLESAQMPLILVGHLPHVNRLAALLVHRDPERRAIDFRPSMMACLSREADAWRISWTLAPESL